MHLPYPRISPEILSLGPFSLRWYSVMYVVGYVVGFQLARRRIQRGRVAMTEADLDAWIAYLVVGMLLGARIVYAIVYQPSHYLDDPLELIRVWHGGLSFHGAVLGMVTACLIFARVHRAPFAEVADTLAFAGTPGLFFGRIGNFINGELYGRPTDVPWAMVFPADPLQTPRHPSQLYQAFTEGIVLFLLLWGVERWALRRGWYRPGLLAAVFLLGYGTLRFFVEFTREPDAQLGLPLEPFSMGQILCVGMIAIGAALGAFLYRGGSQPWRPEPAAARGGRK